MKSNPLAARAALSLVASGTLAALVGLVPITSVQAQQTVLAPSLLKPVPLSEVRARIDKALMAPPLKNAIVGVLVRSIEDGRTIYEKNADLALTPASNLKILTSNTAIAQLGTDFRYTTSLLYKGSIDKNGTLNGDVYLRGSGDPSFSSERLLMMADDLRKAGIKRINGRFIGDGTAFDDQLLGDGWSWNDEPFYYSAQISGLNCDENTIPIGVAPGDDPGSPAKVTIGGEKVVTLGFQNTTYVNVACTAVTGPPAPTGEKPKANLDFERARARNDISVSGTIPRLSPLVTEYMTIEDPTLYSITRLTDVLPLYDIKLPPLKDRHVEIGKTPPDAVVLTESKSSPLNDMIKHFLKESDNLYGEALLKTVGNGKTSEGAAAVRNLLKTAGIPADGLHMVDGSGLSHMDTVTPRMLVSLLIYADRTLDPAHSGAFESALPIGGVDGTLRSRFKNTAAAGQVQAKTGSLAGVSSLSGFVKAKSGERFVFSILMNHYVPSGTTAVHAAQDAIVLALMDAPRK